MKTNRKQGGKQKKGCGRRGNEKCKITKTEPEFSDRKMSLVQVNT